MTNKRTPTKPKLIQLIHIAKSQLHLDDGTYRQMLTEITDKDSCSKMGKSELVAVFEHLKTLGFETKPAKRAGKVALADDAQSRKIRSLWLTLHELGTVRNSSEQALAKYIERQTGKSALQFISTADAIRVIETLKKWEKRVRDEQPVTNARAQ